MSLKTLMPELGIVGVLALANRDVEVEKEKKGGMSLVDEAVKLLEDAARRTGNMVAWWSLTVYFVESEVMDMKGIKPF